MEPAFLSDLTAIAERYNYKIINKTPDSLIIHLPKQNDNIKTIAYNSMEKRIFLTQIQPYITNISEIYDRLLFSVNRDFGKASVLFQPGE
ncbi:hypothetical protein P344_04675 [Spiroplasma mirum ATCC 29335]|uniref:Uncharacterized protein n=1 Tax=Spiroplasma mirum ATCC 29335 TaxID=838561 RepID=W6AM74_9MOLU|nr:MULTISPECIES: hypothetical protein [Spiroplasma]AHI58257.1 hypothetical protein P344_04675 [Spiroplasma mirum ATCC 29335]